MMDRIAMEVERTAEGYLAVTARVRRGAGGAGIAQAAGWLIGRATGLPVVTGCNADGVMLVSAMVRQSIDAPTEWDVWVLGTLVQASVESALIRDREAEAALGAALRAWA